MLVDCGIAGETSLAVLEASLAALGFNLSSITKILLTHFHPDHIGLAPVIHRASNAPLLMHRADLARLAFFHQATARDSWMHHVVEESGVPAGLAAAIEQCSTDPDFRPPELPPVTSLEGGEVLATALGPAELIWTPGHAPGHLCLYFRDSKTLISGDHVLPTISPNITWNRDTDALGDYLASLDKIAAYDVSLVIPSHGEPFTNLQARVNQLKQHHAERCAEIQIEIAAGSETAHQLVRALWPRGLSPIHHWFALFEILAHLEYLRRRGEVASAVEEGICRWRKTR